MIRSFGPTATALLVLLAGAAAPSAHAEGIADLEFLTRPLAGNVHLVASRAGGNVACCVTEEGVLLVDADYEELAEKLEAAVAGLAGTAPGDPPVTWLVNTHWHFDHVGGNAHLAERGALLIAHENVRKRCAVGQTISIIDAEVPPSPAAALPTITFTDGLTFHLGDETVTLHHPAPAHTDGDVVVRFHTANVVHTGDLVFSGGYPFIDLSSNGHIDGMITALETVLGLCDDETVIIPGHGAVLDRAGLVDYVAMLRAFRTVIAEEIAAGHDLAAIQAARPTASIDETWGKTMFSPEMFTEMVYGSLRPE